jgi:hypothetical protein
MTQEISSMDDKKQLKDKEGGSVKIGRHESQCTVCSHPQRQEIEELWIGWYNPGWIVDHYRVSRDALYRHVHAFDLFSKRQRNAKRALERIIERVDHTSFSGSVILSAIKAYTKMNSAGQGVEHGQGTNVKKSFERMSKEEREVFARDGSLPEWMSIAIGATPSDGQEGEKES